ncbi:pentapeptide repeat-containing protein [Streptomyces sp. NPDC090445]|uniref:pentapeptide repeat-containing protein n=1 Tax=Streptomyces sp. NPDC090445 TaxID=3365963 RepID=UPI0037F2D6F5
MKKFTGWIGRWRPSAHPLPWAAVAFVAAFLVLWRGPWLLDHAELARLHDSAPKAVAVSGFRTAIVGLFVAFGAGLGLFFTAQTLRVAQQTLTHTRDKDREQAELTREGQVTDRFVAAVKLLGSETLAERLGGVYALERVMGDSARDHDAIVQLLAAFIREHAPVASDSGVRPPGEDVRAALSVLGRRPDREDEHEIDLSHTALLKVNLHQARLEGVLFVGSCLDGATLVGARLRGSSFYQASLARVHADNADLSCAQLSEANLKRADLTGADLRDALLTDASLQGAHLGAANLKGADLSGARLIDDDGTGITIVEAEQLLTATVTTSTTLPGHHSAADGMKEHIERCTQRFSDGTKP